MVVRLSNVTRVAAAVAVATGGIVALAGCGGQTKVSSTALKSRLAPESVAPGFHLERTLDWSDPTNLVGEGFHLPERTHPSQAVSEVRSQGFEGAAGEQLNQGGPTGTTITTGVMKFGSAAGAQRVVSWMHGQDLQQPCFAQCIFSPLNLPIAGIPGAKAVRQVPIGPGATPPPTPSPALRALLRRQGITPPPPGAQVGSGPPTNYFAEFEIGPYVYFAGVNGGTKSQFATGLTQYFNTVKRLGTS